MYTHAFIPHRKLTTMIKILAIRFLYFKYKISLKKVTEYRPLCINS